MEQWAELRREHFVRGVSIKPLVTRTGLSRNTVRAALRAPAPPRYRREAAGSKLDPFKDEIHRLLKDDAALPGLGARLGLTDKTGRNHISSILTKLEVVDRAQALLKARAAGLGR